MKKSNLLLAIIALFGCLAISAYALASGEPACESGQHYEGSYITSQDCQQVCSLKVFGICLKHKTECTDTSHWEGSCVADPIVTPPVVEPTDPATSTDPVVTPTDPATSTTPVVTPISGGDNSGSDYLAVLRSMCKDNEIIYSDWSDIPNTDLQIRYLSRDAWGRSTVNGCNPTALQQANQIRHKNGDEIKS